MSKVFGIETDTLSIGSELPRYRYGEIMPNYKGANRGQLKIDEIVLGTVVSITSPEEAVVRLPIGTLQAYLHGNLKSGDTLFFKVMETTPTLVLKVHSVAAKIEGIETSIVDIIRMLDLPDNSLFRQLIGFLMMHRPVISRDEALLMYKYYNSIDENFRKDAPPENIFRILFFIIDSNLSFDDEIFKRIMPALLGAKQLQELLTYIEKNIEKLPLDYSKNLKILFSKIHEWSKYKCSELAELFNAESSEPRAVQSIYDILLKFISNHKRETSIDELNELAAMSKSLIDILESQQSLNTFSSVHNTPMYIYLPFDISGRIYIAQLIIFKQILKKSSRKYVFQLSLSTFIDSGVEIITRTAIVQEKSSIAQFLDSGDFNLSYKTHIDKIQARLKSPEKASDAEIKLELDEIESKLPPDYSGSSYQNFSIVI